MPSHGSCIWVHISLKWVEGDVLRSWHLQWQVRSVGSFCSNAFLWRLCLNGRGHRYRRVWHNVCATAACRKGGSRFTESFLKHSKCIESFAVHLLPFSWRGGRKHGSAFVIRRAGHLIDPVSADCLHDRQNCVASFAARGGPARLAFRPALRQGCCKFLSKALAHGRAAREMASEALREHRHVDLAACLCNAAQEVLVLIGHHIQVHLVPMAGGMARIFKVLFDKLHVDSLIPQRLHATICHG